MRSIREQNKADYVIALKGNQPNLHNEVMHFFKVAEKSDFFRTDTFELLEKGHGRIERRTCICLDAAEHLDHVGEGFADLKTVAKNSCNP